MPGTVGAGIGEDHPNVVAILFVRNGVGLGTDHQFRTDIDSAQDFVLPYLDFVPN